jgi:exopolyphosphatase/pppGpp-phosphohydrolase
MRIAVVDIGTNSTRLLVADVEDGAVVELERRTVVTRLGEGVDATGRLSKAAMARVTETVGAYREAIDRLGASEVVAVATSAMRDAQNGPAFRDHLREHFGIDARTISGDEEARLTFRGATAGRVPAPGSPAREAAAEGGDEGVGGVPAGDDGDEAPGAVPATRGGESSAAPAGDDEPDALPAGGGGEPDAVPAGGGGEPDAVPARGGEEPDAVPAGGPGALVTVIDIGGGSTEYVAGGPGGDPEFHVSTRMGSVRHSERFLESDPPAHDELAALSADAERIVKDEVPAEVRARTERLIAVAGTATSLAAIDQELDPYDPERVHGYRLSLAACERMLAMLACLPLNERRRVTGLHPDRAPTIVAGAVILVESIRAFGLDGVDISEADLLHGAALTAAEG